MADPLKPRRLQLVLRGLRGECPRCRSRAVFKSRYRLHPACPACGLPLEHEEGWSLGAVPLNYSFTCLFWILPVAVAFLLGLLQLRTALFLAGAGALFLPFLTYRISKSLWSGLYYAVLPHELDNPPDKKKVPRHSEWKQ